LATDYNCTKIEIIFIILPGEIKEKRNMKINLNNNETELNFKEISVKELLAVQKFSFKLLIIKLNGTFVKKEDYENTIIKDGDKVDVIHLMSGG
jgi:sulfur carrier protein